MISSSRVCVLGAGVVGLSSALAVVEALPTAKVTVVARDFSPNTTSDGAFGLWEPYMLRDTPASDIKRWGGATLKRITQLAHSEEGSRAGGFMLSGYSIFKAECQDPVWKDTVPFFRHMSLGELEQYGPEYVHGWAFTTGATECRFYLPWLTEKLKERGVTFVKGEISDLSEFHRDYDVIVNCAGLGARDLLMDNHLTAMQGQVIRVSAPWVKHFLNSDDEDIYILPGADSVVLGGSHVAEMWSTEVNQATKQRILDGCRHIMPSLKNASIISDWVGLRPSRSRVRLEPEIKQTTRGNIKVVHNYGHGGAGICLHWGCALEASAMVQQLLNTSHL